MPADLTPPQSAIDTGGQRIPARPCRAEVGNQPRRTRQHGRVPKVDDDQRAALRRLRAAFGPIDIIEVISNDPAAAQGEPIKEARMADPQPDDP